MDDEARYRAVASRDRRFDGVFYTAVHTTGIYCRPSCPARTPAFRNVSFHPTAAAAQAAGFRACKRCLPDATPGSPQWDLAADVAGRAMRLIADGVVDREGVTGLAARLGYTSRHLVRLLQRELGAGPQALARSRRAQVARSLIDAGDRPFAEIAFAAGFASVRQFNDTIREVYAALPSQLRSAYGRRPSTTRLKHSNSGESSSVAGLRVRLGVRTPFAGQALLEFLAARAVDGVELADPVHGFYARTLALPRGDGLLRLHLHDLPPESPGHVMAEFWLTDPRDLTAAVERTRRLIDADSDPFAVAAQLGDDPTLGALVTAHPGLRVPGHVDGAEVAVRALLGQQVSVAAARTLAARLALAHGRSLSRGLRQVADQQAPGLARLFPSADAVAAMDPAELAMPQARARALVGLAAAVASGEVPLDRSAARCDVRRLLLALPGIGPWTADYIAMRALGDPDVFLPTDLGVRHGLTRLGLDARSAQRVAERWSPWRSYAVIHLWQALVLPAPEEAADVDRD